MKYIQKSIQNEPASLRKYRNSTPHPVVYDGGNFDKQALRKALLKEQGGICAYCMGHISLELNEQFKPKIEIEHYLSRELRPDLQLRYNNMIGVCNGLSVSHPENEKLHHCDKTQGSEGKMNGQVMLKKLNPCSAECERLVKYTSGGEILPSIEDSEIEFDLNKVLNLNNKVLKNARMAILDNAKQKMIAERPIQQWNRAFLQRHLEEWQNRHEGQFRRYCMIAVWFLKELMNKPKYNL